jgi:hypothetical protein
MNDTVLRYTITLQVCMRLRTVRALSKLTVGCSSASSFACLQLCYKYSNRNHCILCALAHNQSTLYLSKAKLSRDMTPVGWQAGAYVTAGPAAYVYSLAEPHISRVNVTSRLIQSLVL